MLTMQSPGRKVGCEVLGAFPSAIQFAGSHLVLFLAIPMVAIAVRLWIAAVRGKIRHARPLLRDGPGFIALVLTLIGGVWAIGLVGAVSQWVRVRTSSDDIEMIRVMKLSEEGRQPHGPVIEFTNTQEIRGGFATLRDAGLWSSNHEHLRSGYRIEIKLEGRGWNGTYLSAYRHSSRSRDVFVVVPHKGDGHWGAVSKAGDYRCPKFWEWLEAVVTPRFESKAETQPKSAPKGSVI